MTAASSIWNNDETDCEELVVRCHRRVFIILLMEIENGTSPNTDVAIYSGLLVAPERIDNYVFTERLTRFLLCLR